jgi:tRNA(fMet)-specific endonuclease VapC
VSDLILDTNIVSFVMDVRAEAKLYRWHLDGHRLAISFMTIAELYEGAVKDKWGWQRLQMLEMTIQSYIVVDSTSDICRQWGAIRNERRGQPISAQDAWIAATALTCGCPLVTHNPKDFRGIRGLRVITEAGK